MQYLIVNCSVPCGCLIIQGYILCKRVRINIINNNMVDTLLNLPRTILPAVLRTVCDQTETFHVDQACKYHFIVVLSHNRIYFNTTVVILWCATTR